MRIALAQLNYVVNDFEHNASRIIECIERAKDGGAALVVFSELAVCGYPPHDLLDRADFLASCQAAIARIAERCQGISAIVGAPSINSSPVGKPLFNSAFLLQDGAVASVHHKALLPTYDVFDEYRHFEPSRAFALGHVDGVPIAITVCEDLWDDPPPTPGAPRQRLYTVSPMEELARMGPQLVINIAASPFSYDAYPRRLQVFTGNGLRFNLPVIHVNQVGANAELIFDGGSMVLNAKGRVIERLKTFEEDFRVVDTDSFGRKRPLPPLPDARILRIHDALVLGVKDYFGKMGFTRATLGLSGGIDSAVTLAIAQRALGGENLRVLLMPSEFSSEHSMEDAMDLAQNMGVQYDIVGIDPAVKTIRSSLDPVFGRLPHDLAEENMQARVRGILLMALSNKLGYLLLNTSNKSEAAVGFGTLYGDMCGALSVLGDVYKTDVFHLARFINREREVIPINTVIKPPSAELRPNQMDSDSLPEYDVLDAILFRYIEGRCSEQEIVAEGFDPDTVARTIRMVNRSEYKRFQSPPALRVSSKAFGMGRRYPLVAKP